MPRVIPPNETAWRKEHPISAFRQEQLRVCLRKTDRAKGVFGFEGIIPPLSRADVEWLLANHDSGAGPVYFARVPENKRDGVHLEGANLHQVDLSDLPLACTHLELSNLAHAQFKGADLTKAHLQGADLREAQMQGAKLYKAELQAASIKPHCRRTYLAGANLKGADLYGANARGAYLLGAHLESADLRLAQLQNTFLGWAYLQGADLTDACLARADLRNAIFDFATRLNDARLFSDDAPELSGSAKLADLGWNDANITSLDWQNCRRIGDDVFASPTLDPRRMWRHARRLLRKTWPWHRRLSGDGSARARNLLRWIRKGRSSQLGGIHLAIRTNRQVAHALRNQGLNEVAARFDYRSRRLSRREAPIGGLRRHFPVRFILWSWSILLDLVCGYGYKPWRAIAAYLTLVGVFAAVYNQFGSVHGWSALWFSVIAFHGRGVISDGVDPTSPLLGVMAAEAAVGLLLEALLVATLVRILFRD